MSPQQMQFDLGALDSSNQRMQAAVDDLVSKTNALMGEVSDVTVLGTNDTLGSLASMLYGLVIERVQESVQSVQEEFGGHSGLLKGARDAYAAAEEGFVEAGVKMGSDL